MLKGKSVFLRLIEKNDAVLIYSWENDEEIKKVTRIETTLSMPMIDALIDEQMNVADSGQIRFLICKTDSGIPLGTVDLYEVDFNLSTAVIGILIAEGSNRNKGYGKEALHLIHEYATETLEIRHITAKIQKENEKSIAFFISTGYVEKTDIGMNKELRLFNWKAGNA